MLKQGAEMAAGYTGAWEAFVLGVAIVPAVNWRPD